MLFTFRRVSVVVTVVALLSIPLAVFAATPAKMADRVWGQPDLYTRQSGQYGPSATSLYHPQAVSYDANGNLYVADWEGARVVRYPLVNGEIATAADRVWGQPDLTTSRYLWMPTASSLQKPYDIEFDRTGNMYVADGGNNRVVRYPLVNGEIATTADRVWGQPDFTSHGYPSAGERNASSILSPYGLAFDADGNLFVVDGAGASVLRFPVHDGVIATTADRVWGWKDFTYATRWPEGSNGSFTDPRDVVFDAAGNMFVADASNARVLRFPLRNNDIAPFADLVWGQLYFAGPPRYCCELDAKTLANANDVIFDDAGNMYVADGQGRVLRFPLEGTLPSFTADQVWGQPDFESWETDPYTVEPDAVSLNYPLSIALDAGGNLYVAEGYLSRVVRFPVPTVAPKITTQPASLTIVVGDSATLSVAASGEAPLSYQWYQGVSGDTTTALGTTSTITITPTLTGSYWVRVSNAHASVDSRTAVVTVLPTPTVAPTIVTQPQSLTIFDGDTATLGVEADGDDPLSYQWYQGALGDTSTPRSTAISMTVTLTQTASYWVRVSNPVGSVDSTQVIVSVELRAPLGLTYNAAGDSFGLENKTNAPLSIGVNTGSGVRSMTLAPNTQAFVARGNGTIVVTSGTRTLKAGKAGSPYGVPSCNGRAATMWAGRPGTVRATLTNSWTIKGTNGSDVIVGSQYNDTIYGNDGADVLCGGMGADTLVGGAGADSLLGGTQGDTLQGGPDNDRLYGEVGNDTLQGGTGADSLLGGADNDRLMGDAGADILQGEAHNDTVYIDSADMVARGGAGKDTIDARYSTVGVMVNMGLQGFEAATGSNFNDTFTSSMLPDSAPGVVVYGIGGNDRITGSAGADQLFGGAGTDTMRGEKGNDVLTGGLNADAFSGGDGTDRATDYSPAVKGVTTSSVGEGDTMDNTFP